MCGLTPILTCRDLIPADMKNTLTGQAFRFNKFVLHGQRFICTRGLTAGRAMDSSVSFVLLQDKTWNRVDYGIEVAQREPSQSGKVLRFLRVVKYRQLSPAVLGKSLAVLDGDEDSLDRSRLIPYDQVLAPVIVVPKPLGNTAEPDGSKLVAVPKLQF